ncbi:MAG: methylmalonyl-CoA mutase family protein [Bacteroidia bacterium]
MANYSEFESVNYTDWQNKVLGDLKGKPIEKINWQTPEGFTLHPYPEEMPVPSSWTRGNAFNAMDAGWQSVQAISVDDQVTALAILEDAVMHQIPAFLLYSKNDTANIEQYQAVWEKIDLGQHAIHLVPSSKAPGLPLSKALIQHAESLDLCDSLTGNIFSAGNQAIPALSPNTPWFRTAGIDATAIEAGGGNCALQIAVALSRTVDLFADTKSVNILASRLAYRFAIGNSFWLEVAKLRAFRMLAARVLEVFGVKDQQLLSPFILTETGTYNKARYDAHTNMLRTTSEALSASVGGAHAIAIHPYSDLLGEQNIEDARLARNIMQLMRHESYMDRVADPAGGSRYAEEATHTLAETSWALFQEMEALGGYEKAQDWLQEKLAQSQQSREQKAKKRRDQFVGVSNYPNPEEKLEDLNFESDKRPIAQFEKLRFELSKKGKSHQAFLLMYGAKAWRSARHTFASNLLGILGLDLVENSQPDDWQVSLEEIKKASPAIVCLCASDDDYAQAHIQEIKQLLPEALIVVAGGTREDLQPDHFVYRGVDVLSTLSHIVNHLKA